MSLLAQQSTNPFGTPDKGSTAFGPTQPKQGDSQNFSNLGPLAAYSKQNAPTGSGFITGQTLGKQQVASASQPSPLVGGNLLDPSWWNWQEKAAEAAKVEAALNQINGALFGQQMDRATSANEAYNLAVGRYNTDIAHNTNLRNFATQDFNLGMAGLDLKKQLNTLDLGDLAGDRNAALKRFGIDAGKIDIQRALLDAQSEAARDLLSRRQESYEASMGDVDWLQQNETRKRLGQAGVSGITGGAGLLGDLGEGQVKAESQRRGLAEQMADVRADYDMKLKQIKAGKDTLDWDLKGAELQRDEAIRKIKLREDQARIQAKELGITEQKLKLDLQKALENLGYQKAISVGQLLEAQASKNAALRAAANDFTVQATQAKNFFGK